MPAFQISIFLCYDLCNCGCQNAMYIDFPSNATLKLVLSYILNSEYSVCDGDDKSL
jgi:hypothetical protein